MRKRRITSVITPKCERYKRLTNNENRKAHRRFCRQVEAWATAFFAVRSQLDPERMARYAKAGDPYC
jgi:hypothetical protein